MLGEWYLIGHELTILQNRLRRPHSSNTRSIHRRLAEPIDRLAPRRHRPHPLLYRLPSLHHRLFPHVQSAKDTVRSDVGAEGGNHSDWYWALRVRDKYVLSPYSISI